MKVSKEVMEAMALLEKIEIKFKANEKLEIGELEQLGLFYLLEKNDMALTDVRFEAFWFHHFYLIYAGDLTFQSTY